MIRGIIFDLGHTLMYLDSTWERVFDQGAADLALFLDRQGLDVDSESFARTLLDRRAEVFAQARKTHREVTAEDSMRWAFARHGISDPDQTLVTGAIDAFFAHEEACWHAYPEAATILSWLAGHGLRLGMFSNATHDPLIQRLVDRFGFRHWLNPVLSSATGGVRKPDPAAFAPILSCWDLAPESVLVVGDTLEADILGAQRSGMQSLWLRSREDARQEGRDQADTIQSRPDATIERLNELPACLEKLQVV